MRGGVTLTVLCVLGWPATAQDEAPNKDLKALQGAWQLVSSETKGEPRPFEGVQRIRLVISEKKMTWSEDGKVYFEAEIVSIDSSKSPKEITFRFSYPDDTKGKNAPSIYSLTGNILITCGHMDGTRPTEFSTTSEKGAFHLDVWRKVNKKDK
jgi:uncharacterized protein (TIGR03067 family)